MEIDIYNLTNWKLLRKGKVRDLYLPINPILNSNLLLIYQRDRLSSFDRDITQIKGRGLLLTQIASKWFQLTRKIIPNHYLFGSDDKMIVKKCQVIPLEIVVRRYITGSTKTSLWTHYQNSSNKYCYGIQFPLDLKKNQQLPELVITPTTKGDQDLPITGEEIIQKEILTKDQWSYLSQKALELFCYGEKIADRMGLILVDTKYEFGFDHQGQIILIDELHTPDSSRYWVKNSYLEKFNQGLEPDKLDKDAVRDYLKKEMKNVYDLNEPIPEIPDYFKEKVLSTYQNFYQTLIELDYQDY